MGTMMVQDKDAVVNKLMSLEQKAGQSIFFGVETHAGAFRLEMDQMAEERKVTTPWKYINSGMLAGRACALRTMLSQPMDLSSCSFCSTDQEWFINYTLSHPNFVGLDYHTDLFMNVYGVEGVIDGPWSAKLGQPVNSVGLTHKGDQIL